MRSLFLVAIILSSVSCSSADPPAVFVEVDYQIRCIDCEPRSADDLKRQVETLDGDMGYEVDCNVIPSGKHQLVSFSVAFDSDGASKDHTLEVTEAPIGKAEPGSKCQVRVKERANTYLGKCTADEPEEDAPCRIEAKIEGDVVTGTVFCDGLPNESNVSSTRYLVLSDRFGTDHDDLTPATFELHGCSGI